MMNTAYESVLEHNAPIKVNPAPPLPPLAYGGVHLAMHGTLTTATLSNIILTLHMVEIYIYIYIYIYIGWDSDRHGRILTGKPFLHQKPLGQPGGHRIPIDTCITTAVEDMNG